MKEEFLWGGALSNVQAEGAYLEDGKGLNVYDTLVVTPEPGIEPMFCDTKVATDHYHHYQEDIDYMAQMGYKAYRFSVVWSRIHPLGNEESPNEAGLAYYEKMVDYLLSKGIEPVVSLVHFDMPDYLLKNYNGFMNKEVINFYARHVEAVVSRLKGKVKYWLTYNEINLAYCQSDLVAGAYLPDGMSKAEMFVQLNINVQIAHARAVEVIKRVDPQAKVEALFAYIAAFYQRTDFETEVLGKSIVTAVVRRHSHDGTRTVSGKYIVAYPDGNCLTGKGIDGIASGEYTGNATVGNTFAFSTFLGAFQISVYFIFLCVGGKLLYQFAFGSQYHEGDAEHVSARVVKIVNSKSLSFTLNSISAPSLRPIQFFWVSFRASHRNSS